MTGAGDADRDRVGDRTVPYFQQTVERVAWPGGAGDLNEGATLRGRLQMPLLRWRQRGGELGDVAQASCRRAAAR